MSTAEEVPEKSTEEEVQIESTDGSSENSAEPVEKARKASFWQITTHLFKSNLGVGLLSIPQCLARGGLVFGPIFLVLFIIPILHCMFMLLDCAIIVREKHGKVLGYAGTMRYSLMHYMGPRSSIIAYLCNFFIITSQLGFCTAFIIFFADTIQQVSNDFFPTNRPWMGIMFAIILLPSLISRLDHMSYLSGIAIVLCMVSLVGTLVFVGMDLRDPSDYPYFGSLYNIPLFFSTLMYVFEGINVVIPLSNEIKDIKKFPRALYIATFGSSLVYIIVGMMGFIAYGEKAKGTVTLNLAEGPITNTIKVMYALGMVLSYFIQLHIIMTAIMPTILKKVKQPKKKLVADIVVRTATVLLTLIFALAIPQLDNVISLIGALASSSLSLIFPALLQLTTYMNPTFNLPPLPKYSIAKDVCIILIGVVLGATGLYTSITKIVGDYKLPQPV